MAKLRRIPVLWNLISLLQDTNQTENHRKNGNIDMALVKSIETQPALTCSKLTIETQEHGVEYVQSLQ